jgi:hypothetical protein
MYVFTFFIIDVCEILIAANTQNSKRVQSVARQLTLQPHGGKQIVEKTSPSEMAAAHARIAVNKADMTAPSPNSCATVRTCSSVRMDYAPSAASP